MLNQRLLLNQGSYSCKRAKNIKKCHLLMNRIQRACMWTNSSNHWPKLHGVTLEKYARQLNRVQWLQQTYNYLYTWSVYLLPPVYRSLMGHSNDPRARLYLESNDWYIGDIFSYPDPIVTVLYRWNLALSSHVDNITGCVYISAWTGLQLNCIVTIRDCQTEWKDDVGLDR